MAPGSGCAPRVGGDTHRQSAPDAAAPQGPRTICTPRLQVGRGMHVCFDERPLPAGGLGLPGCPPPTTFGCCSIAALFGATLVGTTVHRCAPWPKPSAAATKRPTCSTTCKRWSPQILHARLAAAEADVAGRNSGGRRPPARARRCAGALRWSGSAAGLISVWAQKLHHLPSSMASTPWPLVAEQLGPPLGGSLSPKDRLVPAATRARPPELAALDT